MASKWGWCSKWRGNGVTVADGEEMGLLEQMANIWDYRSRYRGNGVTVVIGEEMKLL